MPTITTKRTTNVAEAPALSKALFDLAKDFFPWIMLLGSIVYGAGSSSTTALKLQNQQLEDHIAVEELRREIMDQGKTISSLSGQLKLVTDGRLKESP